MKSKAILTTATLLAIAVALLFAMPAFPYLPNFSGSTPWKWPNGSALWDLNTSVNSNIVGGSVAPVLQNSFGTWVSAPNTALSVSQRGTTPVTTPGNDNINLICFVCTDSQFNNSNGNVADTIAFTFTTTQGTQILDSDILFNPGFTFLVGGASCPSGPNCEDLQTIATHEIGHFLGLDHSTIAAAVMYPFQGTASVRTLAYDDVAGISSIYPGNTSVQTGSISGTVRNASNNSGVCGIHVFADFVTANSGYPSPVRRSPIGAVSRSDGSYTITGLPIDSYTITAEPMDGPVTKDNVNFSCNGSLPTNFTTRQH